MPRHGTGLGAGNFPAASKLLMRYEHDKAYKLHQQKVSNYHVLMPSYLSVRVNNSAHLLVYELLLYHSVDMSNIK